MKKIISLSLCLSLAASTVALAENNWRDHATALANQGKEKAVEAKEFVEKQLNKVDPKIRVAIGGVALATTLLFFGPVTAKYGTGALLYSTPIALSAYLFYNGLKNLENKEQDTTNVEDGLNNQTSETEETQNTPTPEQTSTPESGTVTNHDNLQPTSAEEKEETIQ